MIYIYIHITSPSHLHHWKHDTGAVAQASQRFKAPPTSINGVMPALA